MSMLEKGGNAFDAAVAAAFTLQVVEPHLNGPGGDVPLIVYDVRRGKPQVICGQGPAPAGATIAHYRSLGLDLFPRTGLLAACRTQEVMDTTGTPHRGVLTADDMAGWQPTVEDPIAYEYGRYTVLKCGAWNQGLTTLQQLALLKGFDFDRLDPTGPDFIHLQVE